MGEVLDFQEVRLRGLALELSQFLKYQVSDSFEAVSIAKEILDHLRTIGRTPETEHLALMHAELFLILIEGSVLDCTEPSIQLQRRGSQLS